MHKLFNIKLIFKYLFFILIIIVSILIIKENKKRMNLLEEQIKSISDEIKKIKKGDQKDSKIKEILKTKYINIASDKKEVSFDDAENLSHVENSKDAEQMAITNEETKLKLHREFKNENSNFYWAQEHEALFWDNFKNWSHLILTSASTEPHFLLDAVECKSSMCYLYIHYDNINSIFDQQREVVALLRSVSNCGFTSVGFDEENRTQEWFLQCEKTNN